MCLNHHICPRFNFELSTCNSPLIPQRKQQPGYGGIKAVQGFRARGRIDTDIAVVVVIETEAIDPQIQPCPVDGFPVRLAELETDAQPHNGGTELAKLLVPGQKILRVLERKQVGIKIRITLLVGPITSFQCPVATQGLYQLDLPATGINAPGVIIDPVFPMQARSPG